MKAVLLAAGYGTRLRPLTNTIPKCLVPILGKPLLELWLDRLFQSGYFKRVLVHTHYLPECVNEFVAASRWKERVDLVYEPLLLGTAGTLLKNSAWIGREAVLVAHADNLTLFDVSEFLDAHQNRPVHCPITMMTFDTDEPTTCGILEQEKGVVVKFHEKVVNPPGVRANAAVYIFESEVIADLGAMKKEIIDMSTEVLPNYLGKMSTHHNSVYHRDIGNLHSLALAEIELKNLGLVL